MPGRINERLYHAILYLIAALVLLAAVAITGIRLALPDIGRYKSAVETWATEEMENSVIVDSISAEWQGWIPSLSLRGVHLRNRDGTENIISFDTATVEISPLMSLWTLQPVPRRIVISGLQVSVSRLADGALLVEGIGDAHGGQQNEFAEWLFGQDRIEVQDTAIIWVDHKLGQDPIHLTGVRLAIQTDGARSQVTGELVLPGKYGENMRFALDATGAIWTSDWSGEIYAAATQVNPDSWYREYRPRQITPAGGSADLELWSTWDKAKPVGLQGHVTYRDFVVLSAAETLNVAEVSGRFRGEKLPGKDWHLSLNLERLETENGAWPATNLEFVVPVNPGQRFALGFDYLDLADLMPLAAGMEFIPGPARKLLDRASIRAELLDGLVVYDGHPDSTAPLSYDFEFRKLDADLGPDRPGAGNLSGRLRGSSIAAHLTLEGTGGRFDIPEMYSNQLRFDRIDGALSWARTIPGWELRTDYFYMENDDMSLALRGGFELDEAQPSPYLDLVAELRSKRLENMYRYMPYTPKFRIREWMERALHAGYADSAIAVLRGYAHEYPFRNNNGQLRGVVTLSRCIVEYSPHWPIVDNVDAEILFDNEVMTANILRGSVFDAQITRSAGVIHDLTKRPKIVDLDGNVKGVEKDLEIFISQSPLARDKILKYANQSLVAGNFDMDLDMVIPIRAPQLQMTMAGKLNLDQARLVSGDSNVELEQVNGAVSFTRDSVFGRDLAALFAGQPVTLGMSGSKNSPHKPPAFTITGHSTDEFIVKQIAQRFPGAAGFAAGLGKRMSGETGWQARFSFEQSPEGLDQKLVISSDLYGLALNLPRPLWKSTYDRRVLTVSKTLLDTTPTEMKYEGGFHAKLHPGQDKALEQLDVFLGSTLLTRPAGTGVNVTGYMDKLLVDEWRDTFAPFTPGQGRAPPPAAAEPVSAGARQRGSAGFLGSADFNIDLETGRLEIFSRSFPDTSLQASRRKGDWRVAVQGETLEGEFYLPRLHSTENRVEVNLDKLVLSKVDDAEAAGKADPGTLPPLRAEIADLTYGDYRLGSMQVTASPSANGLSFEEIRFEKPEMTITGAGIWEKPFNRNRSNFSIDLKADKLHKMLETFGYDAAAIKAGKTRISIDAGWDGSPGEFSLDKLAGTFEIRVKKGQLLEVSPAAGRLFGLLSIQTLPRRLTLDFTDLFGKGLAFDKITGNFNIASGNAYTNDLHLTGPSADVLISGRTGLSDQDYDQLVTVTPQIADNLPLASALLGPVGIGVGAVLYLAGNMFESINDNIDKMLRYQYTITGNWHNPKIEKVKDPAEDKQVSARPAPQPAHP